MRRAVCAMSALVLAWPGYPPSTIGRLVNEHPGALAKRRIVGPQRDRAVVLVTLPGMEGALILCGAEGAVTPLERVAAELQRLVK